MSAPASAASCARPDFTKFLEASRDEFPDRGNFIGSHEPTYESFEQQGRPLQWMGVALESPWGGALFVIDCDGRRLAALPLGAVLGLVRRQTVPGNSSAVQVQYVEASGTGIRYDAVGLASFTHNSIVLLWHHWTRVSVSNPFNQFIDTFTWKYQADGRRIDVSGKRQVGDIKETYHGWLPHSTHALPDKHYCWAADKNVYVGCAADQGQPPSDR